ncbi:MAG TPA: efflux transporter outer membrane subunit [Gemmatimonadaceae bacterium]|jgi:NodT family efflux transporter outer membrane factor (OMF) lipoprotein
MRNLGILLLTFVGACVGAPAYQAPTTRVAPEYSIGTAAVASGLRADSCPPESSAVALNRSVHYDAALPVAPFWQTLNDHVLSDLIDEALRANTDVRIAASRLTGARAARRLAAFDLAPTITASGSSIRQQASIAQLPGFGRQLPPEQLWDAGFDASWEVDLYGRVGRTVAAQGAFAASAEYALRDVQVSVAAEVARTYFELRGAEQQLGVAQRNAENQRRTVSLTQDRLAGGRGTAFDTERARSILYLTLATMPGLETEIARGRNRIAVLLGRTPDALPPALLKDGDRPQLPDTLEIGLPSNLIRRRPDVRRAERAAAAEQLLVGAAKADYLPRISLGARLGYTATSFDSLSRTGTSRLLVGPFISFPLFDLGRVKQRVDLARSRASEAQADYNATVLRALEETQVALVSYDRAHARLAILGEAVRSSQRASALAEQRFEAGLTDFLQVLDAERTLLDAENQLALGQTSAATALVAVYKAIGGTWPSQ